MIRLANKFDLPEICRMLRDFRNQTPIPMMSQLDDDQYIAKIFNILINGGGLAIVSTNEDQTLNGMILGIINRSVWDPDLFILQEMVFWVDPEWRNTRVGYKLLKEYVEQSQELVDNGRISLYTMTKMINSPDLKLDRFGFKKTEEVWVGGNNYEHKIHTDLGG